MKEVWKDFVGYEAYFAVSNLGRVASKRTNKILRQQINKQGRSGFATKIGGRSGNSFCFKTHRLVAEAFIPNPEGKLTVNHKDGNPLNNCVENLEWATHSENIQHAFNTGLIKPLSGFKNPAAKLTEEQVEFIRSNTDALTVREIAKIIGVHHCTVVRCKNSKRYKPL